MPWGLPDDMWLVGIVSSLLGSLIFAILVIICKSLRLGLINIGRWIKLNIRNPEINTEIVLSGNIGQISSSQFFTRMNTILSEISDSVPIRSGELIITIKRFDSYTIEITISPISESATGLFNYFTIFLKMNGIRIRSLKIGLIEVQNFLFKDLVTAIYRNFEYNPLVEKESISVNFSTNPKMIADLQELNITKLTSRYNGIEILLNNEKLKMTGNFTPLSFSKLEKLVISNLIS